MTFRLATDHEIQHWNEAILANPDNGNIFQGYEFSQVKKLGGWKPLYVTNGTIAITVLQKATFGFGKLWYIPKGPGIKTMRELDDILPTLKEFAKKQNVFAVKIEPEIIKNNEAMADALKLTLQPVSPIQPNFSTVLLDIHGDSDTVLASLNQKGRHAIRRAERDGVSVKQVDATDENCQKMYNLLQETAAGSFRIRSYNYYKTFWQTYARANQGQLFFAYYNSMIVAGAYALVFGKKSTYKDGASIRERTAYGASHLLQWHVILWAKSLGAQVHDLCGAPPSDQINNTAHPHYGIGRFKTSFNKTVTDYIGAFDIIIKPRNYKLWVALGQKMVMRLHSMLHNENYF